MMDEKESVFQGHDWVPRKSRAIGYVVSRLGEAPRAEGWFDRSRRDFFFGCFHFFNNEVRRNPSAQAYAIRGKICTLNTNTTKPWLNGPSDSTRSQ